MVEPRSRPQNGPLMSPAESAVRSQAARALGRKPSSLNEALHATGHDLASAEKVFDAMAEHAHSRMARGGPSLTFYLFSGSVLPRPW